jgi:hypothetical protein
MTLTNVWTFNYDLDSTTIDSKKDQLLNIGLHKLVVANAYLTSKGDHQVGGAAAVGFTQVALAGAGSPIIFPVQRGSISLPNIIELHWDLSVIACHARAAVVIEAWD